MMNLFTYGSLMCSDILFRVVDCQVIHTQAILYNFYRSKIRGQEYPGIVPQQAASVPGVLYFDLSTKAIEQLDVFEGELYQRQKVTVVSKSQGQTSAMTYVVKPRYRDILTNEQWSFTDFLTSGKARFEKTYFGFQDRLPEAPGSEESE